VPSPPQHAIAPAHPAFDRALDALTYVALSFFDFVLAPFQRVLLTPEQSALMYRLHADLPALHNNNISAHALARHQDNLGALRTR
jgi:hypothetical protein